MSKTTSNQTPRIKEYIGHPQGRDIQTLKSIKEWFPKKYIVDP
jgi:hypothetical protein